ncbi:MafI family immunity protein [Sphingobacterium multivorum]|uniref:MafI family immunity protein n=1 Tax=Sphingobacterium multivorum TaxID=28454 RepID=UPI0028A061E5|nr:MafI family immunity protein [Sphingobacterium multivorum]
MNIKKENIIINALKSLLSNALPLGVKMECKLIVDEYIEYSEFGLAFEHIVYELVENDIRITNEFYFDVRKVADLMGINEDEYRPMLLELIS